jgi:hypothetical protein
MFILLPFLFPFSSSWAQFTGILHYESHFDHSISTGTIYASCYISETYERVDSRNVRAKSSFGNPGTKVQNTLIFDFDKNKEPQIAPERKTGNGDGIRYSHGRKPDAFYTS